jgi:RHS repeat-associated protein
MQYDALNRLTKTIDPLAGNTQSAYDGRDNLIIVTDALGSQTKYEYDRANRMTKEIRPQGESTTYQYDANGNLATRTNAKGESRSYTYDAANRRTQEQHVAAGGTAANAARTILFSYDERALMTAYTDTGDTNFSTLAATANSGIYTYDNKAQKLTEAITVQMGGSAASPINTSKTTTTSYYPNGLKASVTYAAIGNTGGTSAGTTTYTYDTNNQLKKITTPNNQSIDINAYKWTAPTQKVIPGAVINMTYDALLRPTGMKSQAIGSGTAQAPAGAVIHDTRPTFNAVSNITRRDTEHGTYTYGYDDLDRLTQVIPPPVIATGGSSITLPTEGYTYDAVHNRKSSLHQTGSLANAWTYNAHHQLTQWGDPNAVANNNVSQPKITQTFDANGHLGTKTVTPQDLTASGIQSGKQSHRYFYNASERLIRITDGSSANAGEGSDIASYAYDPFGRRIKKVVSQNPSGSSSVQIGTTTYFYADEGLIAETDSAGNIITTYGWMPNGMWGTAPVFKRDFTAQAITEHYYHNDALGTPQRLSNQAGEITWRAYSEAFGKTTLDQTLTPTATPATINNLMFPGQYEDQETATRNNYMRDYAPSIGRYVQRDPIGLAGGVNTFAYVGGNPLTYHDPLGLFGWADMPTFPQGLVDFSAGFGDSLSFGITGYVRNAWDIGGVNKCSGFYRAGEAADIAFEVGSLGLSAGLKGLAARASRNAVRVETRPFMNAFREANSLEGGFVHHSNPLFGHPGGTGSMFPTGGLPASINSGSWNLQWFANRAAHNAEHQRIRGLENGWSAAVNPATTGIRAARDVADSCDCR